MNPENNDIEKGIFILKLFNSFKVFLRKNLLYLIALIIIGIIAAYFYGYNNKSYQSKVIISPNYGSVDYLYNEIELINSKISENDIKFLNKNGISKSINSIKIKPINNIYQFVQESDKNFDLLKLFAEDGDINKVAIDEKTSKNYRTHQVILNSDNNLLTEQDINKLLSYLNNNEYYNQVRLIFIKNDHDRFLSNENTVKQIDEIFSKSDNSNLLSKSKGLVYIKDNNQLNDLLITKEHLLKQNELIKANELLYTTVIKKISESLNIQEKSKMKIYLILFPLVLIFIFLSIKIIYSKNK